MEKASLDKHGPSSMNGDGGVHIGVPLITAGQPRCTRIRAATRTASANLFVNRAALALISILWRLVRRRNSKMSAEIKPTPVAETSVLTVSAQRSHINPTVPTMVAIQKTKNAAQHRRTPQAGTDPSELSSIPSMGRPSLCAISAGPAKNSALINSTDAATKPIKSGSGNNIASVEPS